MPQRSKHGRRCCCPRRGTERDSSRTGVRGHRGPSRLRTDATTRRTSDECGRHDETADEQPPKPPMSHVRLATIAGLVLVLALGGLTGWLGFRAYESRQGRAAAQAVPSGGPAGGAEPDHDRLPAGRRRRAADPGLGDRHLLRRLPEARAALHRRRQAGAVEVGRHHQRSGSGVRVGRRGAGVGRGDRQDVQCRCARTGAAGLADADHRCRRSVRKPRSPTWSSCRDRETRPTAPTTP